MRIPSYGASASIALAWSAILLTCFFGGAVILLVVRALGETSVDQPVSGTFSHYANKYWGTRASFIPSCNYWSNYIAASAVEPAVVDLFISY